MRNKILYALCFAVLQSWLLPGALGSRNEPHEALRFSIDPRFVTTGHLPVPAPTKTTWANEKQSLTSSRENCPSFALFPETVHSETTYFFFCILEPFSARSSACLRLGTPRAPPSC